MSAQGPLRLAQALLWLADARQTGLLQVAGPGVNAAVHVVEGMAVFAEEGTLGETLGRVLVTQGRLTEAQYRAVLTRMTEALVDDEQVRFGEVAIELGLLTREEVRDGLASQVRHKIERALTWESAELSFTELTDEESIPVRFPTAIAPLVLRGLVPAYDDVTTHVRLELRRDLRPRLVGDRDALAARFGLSGAELRVLRSLDGRASLAELARSDAARVVRLVDVLELAGCIEDVPPPGSIPPEPPPPPPEETRRRAAEHLLSAMRGRAAAAPVRAPVPSLRPPSSPDLQRQRVESERSFQDGARALREGLARKALRDLQRAAQLAPDTAEYQLFARLAELDTTDDETLARVLRAELEPLAMQVLTQDRGHAFAHYVIGRLRATAGDDERAHKALAHATRLDPTLTDAVRWLRAVEGRRKKK